MITRLALAAGLLAVLTNCANNPLDSSLQSDYKAYQTESHFRAFAIAPQVAKQFGPKKWNKGSATSEKSAQAAIDTAMANCEAKGSPHKCRVHAIGNIEVAGLAGPQLDRAIAVYAENTSATIADLANTAQAAEAK